MPYISLIVPIHNTPQEYLNRCMDSLLKQTYKDIEIILVNDGSINQAGKWCDEYACLDSRVHVIHQENQGVSVARNKGIEYSNAKWVTFVDPDDWVAIDMCEKLVAHLKESDLDILSFTYNDVYVNKIVPKLWGCNEEYQLEEKDKELLQRGILDYNGQFMPTFFGPVWGNVYRKNMILENNIKFNPALRKAQDTVFNLYCLEVAGNMKYINEPLYFYRHNEQSVCYKYNPQIDEVLVTLLLEIECFLSNNSKLNESEFIHSLAVKSLVTLIENLKLHYFHNLHKSTYKENKKAVFNLLNRDPYKKYLRAECFKNLSYKKKLLLYSIRHRYYLLLYVLIKLDTQLEMIKNKPF